MKSNERSGRDRSKDGLRAPVGMMDDVFMYTGFAPVVIEVVIRLSEKPHDGDTSDLAVIYMSSSEAVLDYIYLSKHQVHFEAAFEAFFSEKRLLNQCARSNWLNNPCLVQRGLCKGHEDDECQRVDKPL